MSKKLPKKEGASAKEKPTVASSFSGDTSNTSFEDSTSFLISTLGNRSTLIAERDIRKQLDLSYMEWRVIQIIGSESGVVPTRIATVTGVNKANVSRSVNSLEQGGFIHRTTMASNSRHTRLHLTPKGEDYFQKGNAMRIHSEDQFLTGINSDNRQKLNNLLRQVLRNIDQMTKSD